MCKEKENEFKYYLKDGNEIKIGDDIKLTRREETPLGKMTAVITLKVNEDNLEELIKLGHVVKKKSQEKIPMNWEYYAENLAIRLGFNKEHMFYIISVLKHEMPAIAFQMLLKEIALYMEMHEDKAISERDEIYFISITSGDVFKRSTKGIKNFSTFSAFSSNAKAEKAKEILKDFIDKLYGKQEDC